MYRTTGPLVPDLPGLPEAKKRVYWPDINVNFSLAENILNLRKTDALINWNLPHTLEKCGDIRRMIQDFVTNLPSRRGDYHSLAGSLLFMSQIRDTHTDTSATQLNHMP